MLITRGEICHVDRCPHGCTSETGCQGIEARLRAPKDIKAAAEQLVDKAARFGVVLTVEQVPLQPLAMGNYETIVSVRPARAKA